MPELVTLAGLAATATVFVQLVIQHKKVVESQKLLNIEMSEDRAVALVSPMSAPYIHVPPQVEHPYMIVGQTLTPSICSLGNEKQSQPLKNVQPVYSVAPSYPDRARQRQIRGHVDFCFIVKRDGSVDYPTIIAEVPEGYGFAQAALSVFSKWTFEPDKSSGTPIPRWAVYRVSFDAPE